MLKILARGLQLSRRDVCGDWEFERNSACIASLFVMGIWCCRVGVRRSGIGCWL